MIDSLTQIKEVLEKIRLEKYKDIPKDLVEKILIVEFENQDDRLLAQTKVQKIIFAYFEEVYGKEVGEDNANI